ncbi:MAG: FadR/GntR family transcriptional regulator [Thermomicrobiales bacterium]
MTFRSVLVTRSYEQVVEQIHDGIRSGALTPGQRLPTERELGESFGVSRGVVREALKVLASMGLVEARQGSGNYISANPVPSISRALILSATPDEESLLALFELREPMEVLAAHHAAARRSAEQALAIIAAAEDSRRAARDGDLTSFADGDNRLHQAVCDAAGNPYLATIIGAVREILSQGLLLAVGVAGRLPDAGEQHVAIAEAIARGDVDAAGDAMGQHVRYTAGAMHDMIAAGHRFHLGPPRAARTPLS